MQQLQSINSFCEDNIAGIIELKYAPYIWFEQLPLVDFMHTLPQNINLYEIIFKATFDWLTMPIFPKKNKVDFNGKVQINKHGMPYNIDIGGILPQNNPAISYELHKMKNYRFIVSYKDLNNQQKLVGTLDNPLTFSYSEKTDANVGSINGFDFQFTGLVQHLPKNIV